MTQLLSLYFGLYGQSDIWRLYKALSDLEKISSLEAAASSALPKEPLPSPGFEGLGFVRHEANGRETVVKVVSPSKI